MSDDVDGKVCTKCGVWKELGAFSKSGGGRLKSQCKTCCKVAHKAWYEANKEKHAASCKAWREANKEEHAALNKAWREANKEEHAALNKAWREANKEHLRATGRVWREANKERIATISRTCVETLRDKYIKSVLKLKSPTPELIELKREQLRMYRLTRQLNQLLKEQSNDD